MWIKAGWTKEGGSNIDEYGSRSNEGRLNSVNEMQMNVRVDETRADEM